MSTSISEERLIPNAHVAFLDMPSVPDEDTQSDEEHPNGRNNRRKDLNSIPMFPGLSSGH